MGYVEVSTSQYKVDGWAGFIFKKLHKCIYVYFANYILKNCYFYRMYTSVQDMIAEK